MLVAIFKCLGGIAEHVEISFCIWIWDAFDRGSSFRRWRGQGEIQHDVLREDLSPDHTVTEWGVIVFRGFRIDVGQACQDISNFGLCTAI